MSPKPEKTNPLTQSLNTLNPRLQTLDVHIPGLLQLGRPACSSRPSAIGAGFMLQDRGPNFGIKNLRYYIGVQRCGLGLAPKSLLKEPGWLHDGLAVGFTVPSLRPFPK